MKKPSRFRAIVTIELILVGLLESPVLLSLTADRRNQLDRSLLIALYQGQVNEVSFLLKEGADPNARDLSNIKAESLIEHIIGLITRSHGSEYNRTPTALVVATDQGMISDPRTHAELVKLLLDYGADIKMSEHNDHPPLILAEEFGGIDAVRLLLDNGADPNMQTIDGMTALRTSVRNGEPQIVQLLLDHGAKVQLQKDKGGRNDIDEARMMAATFPNYAARYRQIATILTNASKPSQK